MKKKTIQYLVVIAILLLANLGLVFTEGMRTSASFDDSLFQIDNVDQVSAIIIDREDEKVELVKTNQSWQLNGQYAADQNFMNVLLSILGQVKVKRSVGSADQAEGNVTLQFTNGDAKEFSFSSDQLGTRSYFIEEGTSFQVEVPGYRDNVVNIFQLSEDQWRDRVVFNGSWRTIQRLSLSSGGRSLDIRFNNQFFEVDGIAEIDSSGVVDYLNQFQLFQANEMISQGRFPELDSLKSANPLAILTIEDIQNQATIGFKIYPNLEGQSYHLVTKNDELMMVFDQRRIQPLLKFKEDFIAK